VTKIKKTLKTFFYIYGYSMLSHTHTHENPRLADLHWSTASRDGSEADDVAEVDSRRTVRLGCHLQPRSHVIQPPVWRRGVVVSGVRRMNEVNARRARLVLGWVTVYTISVCNQPTKSTQPCIPPGSLNLVPASAVVMAGMSPL